MSAIVPRPGQQRRTFQVALFWWFLIQTVPAIVVGLPLACGYVLTVYEPIEWRAEWPALFILLHCAGITWCLGRVRASGFAFAYTRGYSRDVLWWHLLAASVLAALAVWLPAALIVWTPLRGTYQTSAGSPYYPIMAPREAWTPVVWLIGYGLLLPACHYVWIRQAQPGVGLSNGLVLLFWMGLAAFNVMRLNQAPVWFYGVTLAASLALSAVLLGAARQLHRLMEVLSP